MKRSIVFPTDDITVDILVQLAYNNIERYRYSNYPLAYFVFLTRERRFKVMEQVRFDRSSAAALFNHETLMDRIPRFDANGFHFFLMICERTEDMQLVPIDRDDAEHLFPAVFKQRTVSTTPNTSIVDVLNQQFRNNAAAADQQNEHGASTPDGSV